MSLSTDLRHKITFFSKNAKENDLGQLGPYYEKSKSVWAEIKVATESMKNAAANTEYALFTHKVTIRNGSIVVTSDMIFEYEGQRYEVLYPEPCFKDRSKQIIYARSIVE